MAGMDWFRWHHGSVTDPKFQLVARKAGCSVAEVIGFWAMLLESASMNDVRGCTGTLDFESLDCSLGLQDGKAQELYALMVSRGLVDDATQSIHSWAKRQPVREREDDKSTERVKAFREKKRQEEASNASETPCNATKRLDEIREDEKRYSEAKASGGKPPLTPDEIIFGYGLPILTNAGTAEKQARSFLGGLRKAHGDEALVNTLRECIRAKPLQPLEWLAKAMLPDATGAPMETRYQRGKREQMERDFPNLTNKMELSNGIALELD